MIAPENVMVGGMEATVAEVIEHPDTDHSIVKIEDISVEGKIQIKMLSKLMILVKNNQSNNYPTNA